MTGIVFTTLLVVLILAIMRFAAGEKRNLYEYENIRLIGLIIFVSVSMVWQAYVLIQDIRYRYQASIYMMIEDMRSTVAIFTLLSFPVVFLTWILVTISNINLIRKEGRTWKNALGLFLGAFICISTVYLTFGTTFQAYNTDHSSVIRDYLTNVYGIFIAYLECMLYGTIIMGIVSAKHVPHYDKDYIIILGCMIKKDGTLTPLLKSRVDKALEFAAAQEEATGKRPVFVVSGGQGEDEIISEAEAMKQYLLSQNIEEDRIRIENRSRNTEENIRFSTELIRRENESARIAFSTTNYHVFRAGVLATEQGVEIEGIGSGTKSYFWINAFIREFIATLISERKKNLIALIAFAVSFLVADLYIYYMWFR